MHLVINATEIGRRRGGNESYLTGLIGGLTQISDLARISLLTCDWGEKVDLPSAFHRLNLGKYRRLPFLLWQQTAALRRLEADWYLSTFFLPFVLPCRGAVLVHDLSFRAHPEYFPPIIAAYMRILTGVAVHRAEKVILLSEFTRREMMRFYPGRVGKSVVIYPGIAPIFRAKPSDVRADEDILRFYGTSPGYILAIGNIHPRKNLARLLDAYLKARMKRRTFPPLVWGGLQRWESSALVGRARDAGVIMPGFIAQKDLPAFYRQAAMLVYPSLYEGFGLPPVEAMACGTPVVASNTTALPEAVGDAALTIDPTNIEEMVEAMTRLLDDISLKKRLRQKGLERAAHFTWKRTAQRLMRQLDSALPLNTRNNFPR